MPSARRKAEGVSGVAGKVDELGNTSIEYPLYKATESHQAFLIMTCCLLARLAIDCSVSVPPRPGMRGVRFAECLDFLCRTDDSASKLWIIIDDSLECIPGPMT
jgi:hypothetical protein